MILTLTIIHVVISVLLVIVVLMQHGKQQGMSGAIAGGAETFFGKNKGRTIDAMLKKFTAVIAILFVISSLVLTGVSVNDYKKANEATEAETAQTVENGEVAPQMTTDENGNIIDENGNIIASTDENGNLVDPEGNVIATADQLAQSAEGTEAPVENAEGETPAEEATPAE